MSLIFSVAKLEAQCWQRTPFADRVAAMNRHYGAATQPRTKVWSRFHEASGIGVWAMWREYEGQPFQHAFEDVLLSHFPFGTAALAGGPIAPNPHQEVVRALHQDHSKALRRLHPPLIAIEAKPDEVDIWNDALGLAKTFQLEVDGGTAFGNRPMALHLLGLKEPELDELGWASEQMFGWFLDDLTPYRGLRRLPGGTHVSIRAQETSIQRSYAVYDWFTQPAEATLAEGMTRLREELRTFAAPDTLEIALSGGRDSRASAAVFATDEGFNVRFRTNQPPQLEAIIARQLIERHPNFKRFDRNAERAYDLNGELLWRAASPAVAKTNLAERGSRWARAQEGLAASATLYSDCPFDGPFPPWDRNPVSIAGVGGEAAKAYYWSPNMVSGVFVRNMKAFMEEIRTPITERLLTHPLTRVGDQGFADPQYGPALLERLHLRRAEAEDHGVSGYRFLDLWWFTDRFGAGATTGYHLANTVSPFLAPEFLSRALQDTVSRRANATMLDEMIADMMPSWSEVSFFDQVQNSVPREQTRYYRPNTIVWENPHRDIFMEIIASSDAFDPLTRAQITERFAGEVDPAVKAVVNMRAFGLVHRHFVGLLCKDVSAVVRSLKFS